MGYHGPPASQPPAGGSRSEGPAVTIVAVIPGGGSSGLIYDTVSLGPPLVACAPTPEQVGTDLCTAPGGAVYVTGGTGPPEPPPTSLADLPAIAGGSGEIPYYNLSNEAANWLETSNLTMADLDYVFKNGTQDYDMVLNQTDYVLNRAPGQTSIQLPLADDGTVPTIIAQPTPFSLNPDRYIPIPPGPP